MEPAGGLNELLRKTNIDSCRPDRRSHQVKEFGVDDWVSGGMSTARNRLYRRHCRFRFQCETGVVRNIKM
jgi:hypothetical protein